MSDMILFDLDGKKYEQKIMSTVPVILIGYMLISSPGFLNVMYETWMGKGIMTIGLIAYVLAIVWAQRIMDVEI